jgi:hypothetical protein
MSSAIRISPNEARQKATYEQALLVCAYNDPEKYIKSQRPPA